VVKVLHCIYDDPENPWVAGGGAVRVRELYSRLVDRVDATVLTGSYPGARDAEIDGVRYLRLGASRPYFWSRLTYAAAANQRLRAGGYDVAVFDFSTYTPVFVPRDRPVGITVHHVSGRTAVDRWGRLGGGAVRTLEQRMLGRGRIFSVTSEATRAQLRELVPPDTPMCSVYAGVSDELFALERGEADYVLYFGRIDIFQKGLDTLLEAFVSIAREWPNLELRVAGRGKDLEAMREMATRLGVADRVLFEGAVSEERRRQLFRGALVQLMPSRFEGFGMVAAEAMAAGVPLVATAVDSLPEVVDVPNGGVLVAPGDAVELAQAVHSLLSAPAEREKMSRRARISAQRFRWDRVASAHLDFLRYIARLGSG
jgi:glycosyltransferase involved in cell wall biosynthesis